MNATRKRKGVFGSGGVIKPLRWANRGKRPRNLEPCYWMRIHVPDQEYSIQMTEHSTRDPAASYPNSTRQQSRAAELITLLIASTGCQSTRKRILSRSCGR